MQVVSDELPNCDAGVSLDETVEDPSEDSNYL